MWQFLLDSTVGFIFIFVARIMWKIAQKNEIKQIKLLFKTISLFIIVHLVIFPLIYMALINNKGNSIKIEKDIVAYERNEKMEKALKEKNEIEQDLSKKQKTQLKTFVDKYSSKLSKINWSYIDNKRILKLDSFIIRGKTEKIQVPGGSYYKDIEIYDKKGLKIFQFDTKSDKNLILEIINDYLKELESSKVEISKQIRDIEKNQFWNYRQILPYTLNILFTDNFNPQSRTANLIYFFHNILVVGFLLTVITNLFQFYLLKNK